MSRGRQANTLYLANPEPDNQGCTHLTHPERRNPVDALTTSLDRSGAQIAAIDQLVGPPPPSSDITERVAWIIARRQAEQDQTEHTPVAIDIAVGR